MLLGTHSLTPTAIDDREPNVLATMQQPSSVVHSKLQHTQPLENTEKSRCSVQRFWQKREHLLSSEESRAMGLMVMM